MPDRTRFRLFLGFCTAVGLTSGCLAGGDEGTDALGGHDAVTMGADVGAEMGSATARDAQAASDEGPGGPNAGVDGAADDASGGGLDATMGPDAGADAAALPTTCAMALTLTDGLELRNQALAEGSNAQDSDCKHPNDHFLYYKVTLRHDESVRMTATVHPQFGGKPSLLRAVVRSSCSTHTCSSRTFAPDQNEATGDLVLSNDDPSTKELVVEVGSSVAPVTFDLKVAFSRKPAEVRVTPGGDLATTEAGTSASFQVVLSSPPTASVTIPVASSDPGEAGVSPASLTFGPDNWSTPQTVTVTGVDDAEKDGAQAYSVRLQPATSADPRYQGLDGPDLAGSNRDDDAGVRVEDGVDLATSESGAQMTFGVALTAAPSATVRVPLSTSRPSEAQVSPAELVFEPGNWNTRQTVTLTGVDDAANDGTQVYEVVFAPLVSADAAYAGVDPADLPARNLDDDWASVPSKKLHADPNCRQAHPALAKGDDDVLYLGFRCDKPEGGSELLFYTSTDGGKTWSDKKILPFKSGNFQLAAGPPGVLVAIANDVDPFRIVRSEDGGTTWTDTSGVVVPPSDFIFKLAMRGRYVTARLAYSGIAASVDGGRTYRQFSVQRPAGYIHHVLVSHVVQSDGVIVGAWELELPPPLVGVQEVKQCLRKSFNHGETFTDCAYVPTPPAVPQSNTPLTFGRSRFVTLLAEEGKIGIGRIDTPGVLTPIAVPRHGPYRSAFAATDAVFVFTNHHSEPMKAVWIDPGATSASAEIVIGAAHNQNAAVALSDRTAVVVRTLNPSGEIWVDVVRRP